MNAADRRRMTPILGVVAGLLALLLIALWIGVGRTPHWGDDAAATRLPPAGTDLPAPSVPPLARFSAVWQHPLFSETRTPEPVSSGDEHSSGDLQLTGVIMLPGMKMAILHDRTTGRDLRVVAGEPSKGGPSLLELHPRRAIVDASGSRLQLSLIPGPSPYAGQQTATPEAQPETGANADADTSAMVTRRGTVAPKPAAMPGSDPVSVEARQRALKARIEARRRQAAQKDDGGG